jgi:hypothetical protein
MAEGGDPRSCTDLDVLQHAIRADFDRIGQFDLALENAADINEDVAAVAKITAHIDPIWVSQTNAANQHGIGDVALMHALQFGQLHLAVDPQHLPLTIRLGGAHRHTFGHCQRHDVGQVILALGVVIGQPAQPIGSGVQREWP